MLTADNAILHDAILDILDSKDYFFYEGDMDGVFVDEARANADRLDFTNAVVHRVAELKAPEPDEPTPEIVRVIGRNTWGVDIARSLRAYAFCSHLEAADAWERARLAATGPAGDSYDESRYRVLLQAAETATGIANEATQAAPANATAFGAATDALLNASLWQHTLAAEAHRRAADAYALVYEAERFRVKQMAVDKALAGLLTKVGEVRP